MTPESLTSTESAIELAHRAFGEGNLKAARGFLAAALQMHPDHAELAVALGHLKLQSGGVEEALEEYRKAARINPQLAAAHAACALAYQRLGYSQQAEVAAERALSTNPMESVALNVRTRQQLDAQSMEAARQTCEQIFSRRLDAWKDFTCE